MIGALCCLVARELGGLHPEEFVKEVKHMRESFGFPVTIRRSRYFDENKCYPENILISLFPRARRRTEFRPRQRSVNLMLISKDT